MTEREKIIEAINSVQVYGIMSNAFGGDLPVTNEILADKLIEAGFGYVKDLKAELRSKVDYIHEQDEVIKDCKRRAEVAERALLLACINLIEDEVDNVNAELLARVVYTKALRKAEKEVEEENNAKN